MSVVSDRDEWPIHQPGPAWEAPIPGIHWYGGCEPGNPRVNPATGVCEGCGENACPACGREGCESGAEEAFRCPA